MSRASGGITKFKLNDESYEVVSGSIMPFNTTKTPVNSLSGTPGFRQEYTNPSMNVVLQSTSGDSNPVLVEDLIRLTGRQGEDAIVETNNGIVYLLHQVYVTEQPDYNIDTGEISFSMVAKSVEQLYIRNS